MLWVLDTDHRKYVTETDVSDDNEWGSPANILENVSRILGGYTTLLQQKVPVDAQKETTQLTRFAQTVTDSDSDSDSTTESSDDGAIIRVRVIINKEYTRTSGFKTKKDKWALAQVTRGAISIANLRKDIPGAFRNEKKFKKLWTNPLFEWKIFSFSEESAEIEIDADDDLQDEIDEFCPSDDDSSGSEDSDVMDENKFFKVYFDESSPGIFPFAPLNGLSSVPFRIPNRFEWCSSRVMYCAPPYALYISSVC